MIVLTPKSPLTPTIATITAYEKTVLCKFKERNPYFREVIKGLGYFWSVNDFCWRRDLDSEMHGSTKDRAAELAANLLNANFTVGVEEKISALVQTAGWQPEHKRWVIAARENKAFILYWNEKNNDLYQRAHFLPDARYDSSQKGISVPTLYASEVEGFAEVHNFYFTSEAKKLLRNAKVEFSRLLMPEVVIPNEKPQRKHDYVTDPAIFLDLPLKEIAIKTALYPHQDAAVKKLLPYRIGALFMDMGTGKTRCAIELVVRRQQRVSHVVWFCPVSLKLTIAAEIKKHTVGAEVCVFDEKINSTNLPNAFWYIVGIESMSSSDRVVVAVAKIMDQDCFVVVDESSYIKGSASKRSMRIAEISKTSRYRLLLTGTPISQGVEDLYAQMRFLSPGVLGYASFYSFSHNHLVYSELYPGLIRNTLDVNLLAERINPYTYQVTKEECLGLPQKLYDQVYYELSSEQISAYRQAKEEILHEETEVSSVLIFKLFTTLQQIVSGFWNRGKRLYEYPNHRVEALSSVLNGIPESEKVIIWCKFIYSMHQIAKELPGAALFYGNLSEQKREAELNRFRGSSCRFLVATQATGGHGLTLNEARYHIFYENEFKYSHRVQAEDRSHRIGQTRPVTYVDLVSQSGIDERIQMALAKKADLVRLFRAEVKKVKDLIDL